MTEQFIGQHLLYMTESFMVPQLFYWNRQKRNATAEIDFLISQGKTIIPIEVKSGKTGQLKSLQVFAREKLSSVALRFNTDTPSHTDVKNNKSVKDSTSSFTLISLPLYLVDQSQRLLKEFLQGR